MKRLVASALAAITAVGCYDPYPESEPAPNVTVAFVGSDEDFPNPERGFYAHTGSMLEESFPDQLESIFEGNFRLGFAQTNLSDYAESDISSGALATLSTNLHAARVAGVKMVLRFAYAYDPQAPPEVTLARIERHAEQLAPVFAEHEAAIAYFQAGLIGTNGNWNDGTALETNENMAAVRDLLLQMVPGEIPIQFIRAAVVQEVWYPTPLAIADAFDGSPQARIGLHNDCMMSSLTDFSYFPGPGASYPDFTTERTELEQRTYAAAITDYTPYGGETCIDLGGDKESEARLGCSGSVDGAGLDGGILAEGRRYHLTFLNRTHAIEFPDRWIEEGCFDEVSRSLGYRFRLDRLRHRDTARRGASASFEVDIENLGWGRIFTPRALEVSLVREGRTIVGKSSTDLRRVAPQASPTSLSITVDIPEDADAGAYEIYLAAPDVHGSTRDMSAFAVRFANADRSEDGQVWEAEPGRWKTGATITVE